MIPGIMPSKLTDRDKMEMSAFQDRSLGNIHQICYDTEASEVRKVHITQLLLGDIALMLLDPAVANVFITTGYTTVGTADQVKSSRLRANAHLRDILHVLYRLLLESLLKVLLTLRPEGNVAVLIGGSLEAIFLLPNVVC
jgi:hypothetical protein